MSREDGPDVGADGEREPLLQQVLDAMASLDNPGVTATDISVILGCSTSTVLRPLETLVNEGLAAVFLWP